MTTLRVSKGSEFKSEKFCQRAKSLHFSLKKLVSSSLMSSFERGSGCFAAGLILKEECSGVDWKAVQTQLLDCAPTAPCSPNTKCAPLHQTPSAQQQTPNTKHQTPTAPNTMHHRWKCNPPIDRCWLAPAAMIKFKARCRQSRSQKVRKKRGNAEKAVDHQMWSFFLNCRQ